MQRILLALLLATCFTATTSGTASASKVVWSSASVKKASARPDSVVAAKPDSTVKPNVVWSSAKVKKRAAAAPDSGITRAKSTRADSTGAAASAATTAPRPDTTRVAPAPAPPANSAGSSAAAPTTSPAAQVPLPVPPPPVPSSPLPKLPSTPVPAPSSDNPPPTPSPALVPTAPRMQRTSTPTTPAVVRTSRISYLAGGSAYIDAGQLDGLTAGDTVDVLRDASVIARLRVTFVSSRRASCDTMWTHAPLALGDVARFRSDFRRQAAVEDSLRTTTVRGDSIRTAAVLPRPRTRAASRNARLRGRVGGRWLSLDSDAGSRYQQPALDLRLDGRDGVGGHMDAAVDIRARRTVQSGTTGTITEQFSRVYRASTTIRDHDDHLRVTLGRQSSPTLASISLFDGALFEWGTDRRTLGAFTGTQPDPVRFGWSGDLVEGGAFFEWHQKPLAPQRWSMSFGGVSSRAGTQVNRDFVFGQGWWFSKAASASVAQEVDINSGWKRTLGEPPVSWTSTFATVRVPVTPQFALQSGYDNRRSVRLWRDRETPETDFDDRYRQGTWGGGTLELAQHVRTSAEFRSGSGGDRSDTWSTTGEVYRLTRLQWTARCRFSTFSSPLSDSRLVSFAAGFDPFAQSHIEFSAGTRHTRETTTGFDDSERWQGIDVDLALGGRWYVSGGWEQQRGLIGATRQLQGGVSVRL